MAFSEWFRSHPITPTSLAEAQHAWQQLQIDIQVAHGRPSWIFRLLPMGTRRYHWVRRRVQPLLRSHRGTPTTPHVPPLSLASDVVPNVEILRLGTESLHDANARLRDSDAPWVMFAGVQDADEDVLRLAAALGRGAPAHTEVVIFAGEGGEGTPLGVGPHTLCSYNAVGRGALFPRDVLVRHGGLEACTDPEHDLVLRLCERGVGFVGVPLQHSLERSPLPDPETVQQAFRRRGITVRAHSEGDVVRWIVPGTPTVDIVIPTRDRLDLLRPCIDSIEQRCGNFAVNITIVDNDSREPDALEYLAHSPHRVVRHPGPFNYAQIVNHGVSAGDHEVVVVLNNDTVVSDGWLEALVPLATLPDVGVVGATLIGPDGSVLHAGMAAVPYPRELPHGVVLDLHTNAVLQLSTAQTAAIRNVVAVTGACHVIERSKWERVGGMDESLAVVANDVDLCLRLSALGYYTVLQPHAIITHVGKASRGRDEPMNDHVRFLARWPFLTELRDPCVPRPRRHIAT